MRRWVLLVTFQPEAAPHQVDEWLAAANALSDTSDAAVSSVDLHLPGSVGGGDATWDLKTSGGSLDDIRGVTNVLGHPVQAVEYLALEPVVAGIRPSSGSRIKRTLALTVRDAATAREVDLFERSLQAMPEHILEIRSWSLSRVRRAASTGPWTHVWEQEFDDVDGLRVAYMQHPYHWTGVDRWFDPEVPGSIVEPHLAHVFRRAAQPILTR